MDISIHRVASIKCGDIQCLSNQNGEFYTSDLIITTASGEVVRITTFSDNGYTLVPESNDFKQLLEAA